MNIHPLPVNALATALHAKWLCWKSQLISFLFPFTVSKQLLNGILTLQSDFSYSINDSFKRISLEKVKITTLKVLCRAVRKTTYLMGHNDSWIYRVRSMEFNNMRAYIVNQFLSFLSICFVLTNFCVVL